MLEDKADSAEGGRGPLFRVWQKTCQENVGNTGFRNGQNTEPLYLEGSEISIIVIELRIWSKGSFSSPVLLTKRVITSNKSKI